MSALVEVNSKVYGGWKAFTISKSLETLCGEFGLSVTDNWSDNTGIPPIARGDLVRVSLNNVLLITGYVDTVEKSINANEFSISIKGRDKTKDLIDCSADVGSQFNNLKLEKLCEKLFSPFGISVTSKVNTGAAFPVVSVNQGDSPFEIIDKRVRQKGLLLITNAEGVVEILEPGATAAFNALILGENLLSAKSTFDEKERFSEYKVKGQNNFDEDGVGGFSVLGKATDSNVKRYRPLIIQAENITDSAQAKKRAEYEAIVRASRSTKVTCVVDGFLQSNGALWEINKLTTVTAPELGLVEEELLITSVNFSLSNESEITTLDLMRKDAFIAAPEVPETNEVSLEDF